MKTDKKETEKQAPGLFPQTRWTLLASIGEDEDFSNLSKQALEELCKLYWKPCYVWLLGSGVAKEEAEEIVQGFFGFVMTRDWLAKADQNRGKFRSLLLKSLRNYATDIWKSASTQKRGYGVTFISFDSDVFEESEISQGASADELFDRRWALLIVQNSLEELGQRYRNEGQLELFSRLSRFLEWNERGASQAEAASELGMTHGAFRVALNRMRTRLRKSIENQVRQTVASDEELEEEIKHLIKCL